MAKPCISLPGSAAYVLRGVSVPASVLEGVDLHILEKSVDDLCLIDIEVQEGSIASISAALCEGQSAKGSRAVETVKHRGGMALPTFADLHTHIGKPQWSGVVLLGRIGASGESCPSPSDRPFAICRYTSECGHFSYFCPLLFQAAGRP